MSTFVYTARDDSGSPLTGTITAASVAEVGQLLRREGKYPTSIRQTTDATADVGVPAPVRSSGISVPRAEIIALSTQLAIMLETGVTLVEALDCAANQSEKPNVKALIEDLHTQVQGGNDFSAALARHPRSFPRLYVAIIAASEKSGMLSRMMNRATAYLRDEQETMRKVKGALVYPCIMLSFAVTTTLFLLAFVLPRFTVIYAKKGAALPLPTKILMAASNFVVGHWLGLVGGVLFVAVALYIYLRTASGARAWHHVQLSAPLLGSMYRKLYLARGLRMIGTMASAGVSLMDCVATAHDLCSNGLFRDLWDDVSRKIQTGKQLSEPLFESALVPRSVAQMIHSGEKSGKLAQVMEQVAGYSEIELKEKIAEMTRYIEPLMIVIMGVIIGGVALALMLPIFTISRVVAQ